MKNTKKSKGKRKLEEDNSMKFQTIINSVAADGIYMPEFYKFLYKKNNNISEENLDKHVEEDLAIYRDHRDYINDKNKTCIKCVYFKKGHWYSVINGMSFDSFKSKIQISGTNGFCQSYAIYLAANNGEIDKDFKKEDWITNTKKMACLHCEFINTIDRKNYKVFHEDFIETFNNINENEKEEDKIKPVTLDTLKSYLQEICYDDDLAHEFSVSKEDHL